MSRPILLCATLIALTAVAAGAQTPPPTAEGAAPEAGSSTPVSGLALVAEEAGPAAWAPPGDRIAYSRRSPEGYMRLYTADPDGADERCLSCLPFELRKRHVGEPAWHPSGDFLVARVAKPFERRGRVFPFADVPGRNLGDDLWYFSADGKSFGNLTRRGERGGRVLAAQFSPEGGLLAWSERVASGGGAWGQWVLRLAELGMRRGVPRMGKVRTLTPGDERGFRELYGFTADEDALLFGMQAEPGDVIAGMRLGIVTIASGAVEWLTAESEHWDRFASIAPNGDRLVWASSRGLPVSRQSVARNDTTAALQLDLWMMRIDGGDRVRLTGFNDPFSPQYSGRVTVRPGSWSRDGRHLLLLVTPVDDPGDGSLFRLQLDAAYGR